MRRNRRHPEYGDSIRRKLLSRDMSEGAEAPFSFEINGLGASKYNTTGRSAFQADCRHSLESKTGTVEGPHERCGYTRRGAGVRVDGLSAKLQLRTAIV